MTPWHSLMGEIICTWSILRYCFCPPFKLINLTRIIAHWRQFFAGKYPFIYPTGNWRLSRRSILFGRKSWNMHLYVLFILQRTENGNANAKLTTKCMRHYRANWTSLDRKSMGIFNVGIAIFLPVYLAPTDVRSRIYENVWMCMLSNIK